MGFADVIHIVAIFVFFLFWLVSFFILYHLTRFGIGLLPKRLALLFLVGAIILFSASLIFALKADFDPSRL